MSLLTTCAVPIFRSRPDAAFLPTLRANLARSADNAQAIAVDDSGHAAEFPLSHPDATTARDYCCAPGHDGALTLAARKHALLSPEYGAAYVTVTLKRREVTATSRTVLAARGEMDVHVAILRERFLATTVWLHFDPIPSDVEARHLTSMLGEVDRVQIAGDGITQTLSAIHDEAVESALLLAGSIFARRPTLSATPGGQQAAFAGVVADVARPFPPGFGVQRDLVACAETRDWHCAAAELLPPVRSRSSTYHTSYLHELLGEDVMDSVSAHYYISPGLVLSLSSMDGATNPDVRTNLCTWTQLLCESAALQRQVVAELLRQMDAGLRARHSARGSVSRLIADQWSAQMDLMEYDNVGISRNDVYWRHLRVLQRVSGLDVLQDAVARRREAVMGLAALEESRTVSRSARLLSAIFGTVAVANLTQSSLTHADVGLGAAIGGTVAATLIAAGIAASLVRRYDRHPR